jgi:hypothetical protein
VNLIIKCLSLWQPHASLVSLREKLLETRSWQTTHRGLLAIHAAKAADTLSLCREEPFAAVLRKHKIYSAQTLPLGVVLCLAELEEIYPVETIRGSLSTQEAAFGNYGPGRFAWKLKVVHVFETPLPCKGAQGIFALPPGLTARIQREYAV